MANEVGSLNGVAFGSVGALNSVAPGNIAAINDVQFVATVADSITLSAYYGTWDGDGALIAGASSVVVTSSGLWLSSITYNEGTGWITRTPTFGSTGTTVAISVSFLSHGTRSGKITFTRGTASIDFLIQQEADI